MARVRQDVDVKAADLLSVPEGDITETGLRLNLNVGIQYTAAWLAGSGCVPLNNLMEDAATAEISRTQVWQWRHHGAKLDDGRVIDDDLIRKFLGEEIEKVSMSPQGVFDDTHLKDASDLFETLIFQPELAEFLTLPAYERLVSTTDN